MFNAGDRVFTEERDHRGARFQWTGTVTTGKPREKDGKIAVKWDVSGPLYNDPATLTLVED